jgi:phospholipid/cholesterol/gamma-HCH transport system ATP-binding protein
MENIIDIHGLRSCYGTHVIHDNLDLQVKYGEILALVGGSGSGKTTLLRQMILLQRPDRGIIRLFDEEVTQCSPKKQMQLQRRCGVMFQSGALFSSLTVLENVCFPLKEFTRLSVAEIKQIAMVKIHLAQFPADAVDKYPAELSGGMLKRAALARTIALDPEILFLDEPTAGLDPQSAAALDQLVLKLKKLLQLTVVMITHDLDSLMDVPDRIAFLAEQRVLAVGSWQFMQKQVQPEIQHYFHSARACKRQQEESDGNTH